MSALKLIHARGTLDLSRPVLMGILNITPDSFSDGGNFFDVDKAVAHGLEMAEQGAAIIDVGGESTRPGSEPVPAQEQIKRTAPVIEKLSAQINIPISIDTTLSPVAQAALDAGAAIVNDIAALRSDDSLPEIITRYNAGVILMHMQGTPRDMQKNPTYKDVVREIKIFLQERINFARSRGIARDHIAIDPGIGFGKTLEHNLEILRRLSEFHELEVPVLIGASRKRFIAAVLDIEQPNQRIWGDAAVTAWCAGATVHIIRVHDVKEMVQIVKMVRAIRSQ